MDIHDADSEQLKEALKAEAEDRIRKATALSFMIQTEGWEILLNTFENMKQDQLDVLSNQIPGNEKAILAAHSVWYAVVHTLEEVVGAINTAIQDGEAAKKELDHINHVPQQDDNWL